MNLILSIAILLLLLSLIAGLWRIWAGPDDTDRMLIAQLFGTTGTGILLLLSVLMQSPVILDIAIVLALLAVVTMMGFVQRVKRREK